MHNYLHSGDGIIWILIAAAQMSILTLALKRGIHRTHPWIIALLVCINLRSISLLAVAQVSSPAAYYYTYWIWRALEVGIRLAVAAELIAVASRHSHSRRIHRAAFCGCVILVGCLTMLHRPQGFPTLEEFSFAFERMLSLAWCIMLVALVVGSRIMGWVWSERSFGIASGLAIAASANVATHYLIEAFGVGLFRPLWRVNEAVYIVSLIVWALAFKAKEPALSLSQKLSPEILSNTLGGQIVYFVPPSK